MYSLLDVLPDFAASHEFTLSPFLSLATPRKILPIRSRLQGKRRSVCRDPPPPSRFTTCV